jgi:RNA polymerase sigma-70 factor (ECF subfamily)
MSRPEDFDALVAQAGRGDRAAFLSVFDLTAPHLFGLCLAIVDERDWAAELVEQVYIAFWQASATGDFAGLSPLTWLIDTARQSAAQARRDQAGEDGFDAVELRALSPSAAMRASGPDAPLLRRALGWLPTDRRDALLLSYFTGLRPSELATRFRVPHATMRNWQQRSLARLHRDLTGRDLGPDGLTAGEYVLGALPTRERAPFEARLAQEPDLRQAVVGWTEDLVVLTDSLPDAPPPETIRQRLDVSLFGEQALPLWRRLRLGQAALLAMACGAVAWWGQDYLTLPTGADQSPPPAQVAAPGGLVAPSDPGQDLGPGIRLDPASGQVQMNGDFPDLAGQGNLAVYLDFGADSEWVELGTWPMTAPRRLMVPPELMRIAQGAEMVVLGGPGSDRELLRMPIQ